MANKVKCLEDAIEITKQYCRGGGSVQPDVVLQDIYDKLKELDKDAEA